MHTNTCAAHPGPFILTPKVVHSNAIGTPGFRVDIAGGEQAPVNLHAEVENSPDISSQLTPRSSPGQGSQASVSQQARLESPKLDSCLRPPLRPSSEMSTSRATALSQRSSPVATPSPGWQTHHNWKSPILMVIFLLIGVGLSVGHCVFYPSLNGQLVGGSSRQEEKLR